MTFKPVHRYMTLVQCPVCHDLFMEQGEESCWRCQGELEAEGLPAGLEQDPERLHTALERLHERRLEAEAETGAMGSLSGIGFEPWPEGGNGPAMRGGAVAAVVAGLSILALVSFTLIVFVALLVLGGLGLLLRQFFCPRP